ncbi:MAG: AAA family ATPase [Solirubrobacteraceae bacterium]
MAERTRTRPAERRPVAPHPQLAALRSPDLVGRATERALLLEAAVTPPAVVVIEGEAGIGKTRLIRDLLADPALAGRRRLTGHCHRLREPFPFGPFIEALRTAGADPEIAPLGPVAGSIRALLPELADQLPLAPDPLPDPRAQRHRLFIGLLELLGALGPTVLVIEDLHWADPGSAELLRFILCRLPAELAVLLTYRRAELDAASPILGVASRVSDECSATTISLPALDRAGLLRLAESMLDGQRVPERLAGILHQLTGGNPFALQQLLRSLRERGQLMPGPEGFTTAQLDALEVPPALRDSILQRVGALHGDGRLITQAAAVLERPACEELLTKVAGLSCSRGNTGLLGALSPGLVREVEPGLYALCHALAGQAVYEAVPTPQRRLLHLRAARALEASGGPPPLAQLAHHFNQAGRPRQGVRYAERAADASAATGDDRSAAEMLEQALSTGHVPGGARTRMALKLGEAALFGRVPGCAIPELEAAIDERSVAIGVRGELRFCLARLLYLAGDADSAYRHMVTAAHELERRPGLAAQAMATLAAALGVQSDVNEHLLWADRALRAGAREGAPGVMTAVLGARADILLRLGDPAGWLAVEAIPGGAGSVEQRLELVRVYKYLASATLLLGHYGRTESFIEHGDRIRRELGHARFGTGLATVRAHLEWATGRWDGLEERVRSLAQSSAEGPVMSAPSDLILAWLLLRRGEIEPAERRFDSALNVFRGARDLSHFVSAAKGLGRIYLARGDPHAARELATVALYQSRENATWTWTYPAAAVAVDALIACGSAREARDLTARFARGMRGRDAPAALAALAFCRGVVAEADGRSDVAARRFGQAERAWRKLPCPYEAAHARERRGKCLLETKAATAGDCLLGALAVFDHLGATWDSARVKATLRAHKVALPYPWRGGSKGYGQDLSPREAQIAHLAGTGRTNREIAEALFISSRTVESHVASAIRKQGVSSRKELEATPATSQESVVATD